MDNQFETAPIIDAGKEWTALTDMGKTSAEIFAAWGLPQYGFASSGGKGLIPTEVNCMTYTRVNINGHKSTVDFSFHNDKVIEVSYRFTIYTTYDDYTPYDEAESTTNKLLNMLNEPVWIFKKSGKNGTRILEPIFTSFMTDEKYMISIYATYSHAEQSYLLSIDVISYNPDSTLTLLLFNQGTGSMQGYWQRDDFTKGGDYDKLVKLREKLKAKIDRLEKEHLK